MRVSTELLRHGSASGSKTIILAGMAVWCATLPCAAQQVTGSHTFRR
jgi:hypothetical protein